MVSLHNSDKIILLTRSLDGPQQLEKKNKLEREKRELWLPWSMKGEKEEGGPEKNWVGMGGYRGGKISRFRGQV